MSKKPNAPTIALISDIHGNLPALEAVMSDMQRHDAEVVWNLGDMLGYAPFPNEVLDTLRAAEAISIIGNYDQKVLAFAEKRKRWKKRKPAAKYAAFHWNDTHLSEKNRAYLASLPEQVRCQFGHFEALLVHGSPVSVSEALGDDTPEDRLTELAETAQADLVVCGHSHEPFVRRVGRCWFVNPGSAGRPEGGDWRASYATLSLGRAGVEIELRRVAYDIERVARGVHAAGLPTAFIDVFRQAKSLDQLWADRTDVPGGRGDRDKALATVLSLAERCQYEREHTHQVTKLALELFDGLKELHQMGTEERFWLQCGSLLHDIGWSEGRRGHHKTAMRLILADPRLTLFRRERQIVALVARYHRKALPSSRHKPFSSLGSADQRRVRVLAGLLRIADGLDRSHEAAVETIRCRVFDKKVVLFCRGRGTMAAEAAATTKKADLFRETFGLELVLRFQSHSK